MRHRTLAIVGLAVAVSAALPAHEAITIPYPDSAVDDDGGGGSGSYSERYCGHHQWNNGTRSGDKGMSAVPCQGSSNRDNIVGTGTSDNPYAYEGAGEGFGDIITGQEGDDLISGGESADVLWGDFANGDRYTDGDDVISRGSIAAIDPVLLAVVIDEESCNRAVRDPE